MNNKIKEYLQKKDGSLWYWMGLLLLVLCVMLPSLVGLSNVTSILYMYELENVATSYLVNLSFFWIGMILATFIARCWHKDRNLYWLLAEIGITVMSLVFGVNMLFVPLHIIFFAIPAMFPYGERNRWAESIQQMYPVMTFGFCCFMALSILWLL